MKIANTDEIIVSLNDTLLDELQQQELDEESLAQVQGGAFGLPFGGSSTLRIPVGSQPRFGRPSAAGDCWIQCNGNSFQPSSEGSVFGGGLPRPGGVLPGGGFRVR